MYLPSDTPILTQQRADAARHGVESDARIEDMRRTSACGRAALFQTLVNPGTVTQSLGVGAGVNTAKLQQQTDVSRAAGILSLPAAAGSGPSVQDIIANAPEVVSLNRGGSCGESYAPVPLGADPVPGMPHRAPNIVESENGPMYYRGQDATYQGGENAHSTQGLAGYAPAWGDAGLVSETGAPLESSWLMENKWLVLGLVAAGAVVLSRRSKA